MTLYVPTWIVAITAPSNIMREAAVRTPRPVLTARYDQKVKEGSASTPSWVLLQSASLWMLTKQCNLMVSEVVLVTTAQNMVLLSLY